MIAPPLLVSFSDINSYVNSLSEENQALHENNIRSLFDQNLPPIGSISTLSTMFGFSPRFVAMLLSDVSKQYRTFEIRKGKKKRKIQAPKVGLKVIQKWFGHHLSGALVLDDGVYGFVPNRSAIDAASKHCTASWVYSFDIKDFFPSTTRETVLSALVELGYVEESAELISQLCCLDNKLPQGAPSSPALSNLVMRRIDTELARFADENNLTYTRYADDIVLSGKEECPESLSEAVRSAFKDTDWELNPNKEYYADVRKGQRLKVHGLLVMGEKPILTKGYRNKLRAYNYMIENGKAKEKDLPRLKGHIEYARLVDRWNNG
ncbi:TPA: reverse transcriptase family protein [Vibrio parahaemolyticus]|nr:RNA-directed DNA polymerase [Vibrio parahaemolyticus]EJG2039678.1 RNA-directed DNA polymerase [Vibrio parahaemolyticus]EJG2043896.1 RNA-directed DNA polymerase [Vibrio parahaemolyticus]EJG2235115.1 RNA-directed DNA polymerase [Vibrio parahaemolyticus]MBE3861276.1 RNA-directed DNA polymerase [Vibrio parahaemolyticus]